MEAASLADVNIVSISKELGNCDDGDREDAADDVSELSQHSSDKLFSADDELMLARVGADWSSGDVDESNAKKAKKESDPSIPRILDGDIRRYYSRMFLNTLNSGDFTMLQDYFYTFMCGPCKFVAEHVISPEFSQPALLVTDGPRLIAHYCLGLFVMYPDMVLSMKDSRVVTSDGCTGSKIEMDIQVRATKMYDISMDAWVPKTAKTEGPPQAGTTTDAPVDAVATHLHSGRDIANATAAGISVHNDKDSAQLHNDHDTSHDTSTGTVSTDSSTVDTAGAVLVPVLSEQRGESADVREYVTNLRIVGTSELNAYLSQGTTSTASGAPGASNKRKSDALDDTHINHKEGTNAAASGGHEFQHSYKHIPLAFIHALSTTAKPLPKPLPLLLQGKITMYLDENNHIQHMNLNMVQKNVVKFS